MLLPHFFLMFPRHRSIPTILSSFSTHLYHSSLCSPLPTHVYPTLFSLHIAGEKGYWNEALGRTKFLFLFPPLPFSALDIATPLCSDVTTKCLCASISTVGEGIISVSVEWGVGGCKMWKLDWKEKARGRHWWERLGLMERVSRGDRKAACPQSNQQLPADLTCLSHHTTTHAPLLPLDASCRKAGSHGLKAAGPACCDLILEVQRGEKSKWEHCHYCRYRGVPKCWIYHEALCHVYSVFPFLFFVTASIRLRTFKTSQLIVNSG